MKEKRIVLIEDHHQALEAWCKKGFKGLPLVHLDAHIDFGFYQAKPIEQIVKEAKSIKQIQQQLEKTLLYQRYKEDLETQLNIGNYIYPAMRDGLVGKFYWVVPGDRNEFEKGLWAMKRLTKRLKAKDPEGESRINENSQRLTTRLYRNDFEVTSLSSLKRINEPVLLDIDLDFLLFDSIRRVKRDDQLFKFFKQRYESFRNYFYKYQKKILLKEKREDQLNRQAKSFERIDKRLKTLQAR